MAGTPKKKPFFKLLLGDFSRDLRIPPPFVERFIRQRLRKCALRGPSEKSWSVKVEERDNDLFFRKGWKKFVKDNFLEHGDFLIFRYDGASKFDVTIYDKTCCEKDIEEAKRRGSSNADSTSEEDVMCEERPETDLVEHQRSTESIAFRSDRSYFIKTLKRHTQYQIPIPKTVSIAQGLSGKETLTLQASGKSWKAKLSVMGDGRLLMTKGWAKCHSANQVAHGDTIFFEFVEPTVVQVHFYKRQ